MRLAKSQRLRIENSAFNYASSSIELYDSLTDEIKKQEQK